MCSECIFREWGWFPWHYIRPTAYNQWSLEICNCIKSSILQSNVEDVRMTIFFPTAAQVEHLTAHSDRGCNRTWNPLGPVMDYRNICDGWWDQLMGTWRDRQAGREQSWQDDTKTDLSGSFEKKKWLTLLHCVIHVFDWQYNPPPGQRFRYVQVSGSLLLLISIPQAITLWNRSLNRSGSPGGFCVNISFPSVAVWGTMLGRQLHSWCGIKLQFCLFGKKPSGLTLSTSLICVLWRVANTYALISDSNAFIHSCIDCLGPFC